METGFANDPHSERGYSCPKNTFGYTDYRQVQLVEAVFVQKRAVELEEKGVTGKFDIPHLQSIHRYFFQDAFPWAGEFRVVNISKGNTNFGPAMHIGSALKELFERLAKEKLLAGLTASAFVERAAFYLGEINAIHPFPRGQRPPQREFNTATLAPRRPSAFVVTGRDWVHAAADDRCFDPVAHARRQQPACCNNRSGAVSTHAGKSSIE